VLHRGKDGRALAGPRQRTAGSIQKLFLLTQSGNCANCGNCQATAKFPQFPQFPRFRSGRGTTTVPVRGSQAWALLAGESVLRSFTAWPRLSRPQAGHAIDGAVLPEPMVESCDWARRRASEHDEPSHRRLEHDWVGSMLRPLKKPAPGCRRLNTH
jgi:hypothetical protein